AVEADRGLISAERHSRRACRDPAAGRDAPWLALAVDRGGARVRPVCRQRDQAGAAGYAAAARRLPAPGPSRRWWRAACPLSDAGSTGLVGGDRPCLAVAAAVRASVAGLERQAAPRPAGRRAARQWRAVPEHAAMV